MADNLKPSHKTQKVSFLTADDVTLVGQLFQPSGAPELAIVIHGATAVRSSYYADFAAWLCAERNAAVLIYDYRDFGDSATVSIKDAKANMSDWGIDDQSAALDYLCQLYPGLPIEGIGHSMGGLFLAFHTQSKLLRRFTAVASGPAHWTRHPLFFMPAVIAFWFAVGPLLVRLFGYLPGRKFGFGSDVPAGVYWQWRRWCLSPKKQFHREDWGRHLPEPDLAGVQCPLMLISISDDPMILPHVVKDLAAFYPNASTEHLTITPKDISTRAIGHISIFSERGRSAWPRLAG